MKASTALLTIVFLYHLQLFSQPVIYANQVGYDAAYPKMAVISTNTPLPVNLAFSIVNTGNNKEAFTGRLEAPQTIADWMPGKTCYRADFSAFKQPGNYVLSITADGKTIISNAFQIEKDALAKLTTSSIIHYYNRQRANTPAELEADEHMHLVGGGNKTVDVHGGWCDASGDVSKYFSHLAYANFMSPQQTPLVVWSMESASEGIPKLLEQWQVKDSLDAEALYGADYMMRSLSPDNYFYMTVFSYFNKDPHARRIVGLHANSVTTDEYQCAFREGGRYGHRRTGPHFAGGKSMVNIHRHNTWPVQNGHSPTC